MIHTKLVTHKNCKRCKNLKSIYSFHPSKEFEDGLLSTCRDCVKNKSMRKAEKQAQTKKKIETKVKDTAEDKAERKSFLRKEIEVRDEENKGHVYYTIAGHVYHTIASVNMELDRLRDEYARFKGIRDALEWQEMKRKYAQTPYTPEDDIDSKSPQEIKILSATSELRSICKSIRKALEGKTVKLTERKLKILGVRSLEEAVAIISRRAPKEYTLSKLPRYAIDHMKPLAWWDLTVGSEILKAGNIDNLQLLPKEQNFSKLSRYGHMPDGSIILYEDWIATKSLSNVEDNGVISKENGISID